ncbi:MAG: hypothetical protein ACQEXQ_30190 [Bacillota bacterium]
MIRNRVIVVCLILSLLVNTFLLIIYFGGKSNQIELENAILMNEFVEREKEWRHFRAFIGKLAENNNEHFPITPQQSELYWILATPEGSVIMKATHSIRDAEYEFYNHYSSFIIDFDTEYATMVRSLESKLSIMNNVQLEAISNHLDEAYDLYKKSLDGWSVRSSNKKFDIQFEPQKEELNQVIQELMLIREELEGY